MAKFCGKCGKPIPDGKSLCEQCEMIKKDPSLGGVPIVRETPDLQNMKKDKQKHKLILFSIIVAALLVIALLVTGVVILVKGIAAKHEGAVTNKNNSRETVASQELYPVYVGILDDIVTKKNQKEHEYINSLSVPLAEIAYIERDIDGNGTKELIIYEAAEEKNLIYELYTVSGKKAICLTKSSANSKVYLTNDNTLLIVWQANADEYGEDIFAFNKEGNELVFTERVAYDSAYAAEFYADADVMDETMCWFYSDTANEKSGYKPMTQDEVDGKRNQNEMNKATLANGITLDKHKVDADKAPKAENKDEAVIPEEYMNIIADFVLSYPWDNGVPVAGDFEMSELFSDIESIDEIECSFEDVNNDGITELLLGSASNAEVIYDMFTVYEGNVYHILSQDKSTIWHYCNNQTLLSVNTDGESEYYKIYILSGTELDIFESYERVYDPANKVYNHVHKDATEAVIGITEEDFYTKTAALAETYVFVNYKPAKAYTESNADDKDEPDETDAGDDMNTPIA